jgi:Fe-S-cluster containining protein
MNRVRIAIVGDSPCDRCTAACCKQSGHEYSALLEGDEVRRFAPYAVAARIHRGDMIVVEKVLPYVNGRCIFLGDDDRCLVYEARPNACRVFECTKRFNRLGVGKHDEFLTRNPRVLQLLESL